MVEKKARVVSLLDALERKMEDLSSNKEFLKNTKQVYG